MIPEKTRIAVATRESKGLQDTVSEVFGRAKTFTLIDVREKVIQNVEVLENPAASLKQGAGPVATKTLGEAGVNIVAAGEIGPGASTLLGIYQIREILVKPGTTVDEAIKMALQTM
jgi:predicted Fe-Mo cluster-binding NifX family protein